MRRRFGRKRRGRTSDTWSVAIDAERWFERLTAEGHVPVTALQPIESEGVPASFAVLGTGETEAGDRVLVGFAPENGGDAALAVLAHAAKLATEEEFSGEAIEIADDGVPGTGNCASDAGETVHQVLPIANISWGTTASLANGAAAPDDLGGSPGTVSIGWSFTDAGGTTPAQWVLFQPDGLPRLFTPAGCVLSGAGEGGGAIYVTNGRRDYAVVLGPLGTTRVHPWTPSGWRD